MNTAEVRVADGNRGGGESGAFAEEEQLADGVLPRFLDGYADYALPGLFAGTVLCLVALFTNRVPDPSFPWFSLPAPYRLPVSQPRIEHWPVTYTAGIWLWVAFVPAVFLRGYRRYAHAAVAKSRGAKSTVRSDRLPSGVGDARVWLAAFPVAFMFGATTYCRFFWPKPSPATWNAPSYTFVCWLYCSSYVPFWSDAAYAVALFGVGATALAFRDSEWATYALAAFGVLALPLGIPALFEAYRRHAARSASAA